MATRVHVVVDQAQLARVQRVLGSISAPKLGAATSRFLLKASYLVLNDVVQNQIIRQPKGPVHPTRLTNRHGGAGIVGSMSANQSGTGRGQDTRGLPRYIDVGTDKKYGPLHEFGGTIARKARAGKSETRSAGFGSLGQVHSTRTVGKRRAHSATYPPRPYLAPAVAAVSPRFEPLLVKELEAAVAEAAR